MSGRSVSGNSARRFTRRFQTTPPKPLAPQPTSTRISKRPEWSICSAKHALEKREPRGKMKRGDFYWAELVPRSGSEQTGHRPVSVLSHDGFNQTPGWRSVIVVPVTTSTAQSKRGPTVVEPPRGAGGLAAMSFAICHQVTTFDPAKLTKRLGSLPLPRSRTSSTVCGPPWICLTKDLLD